ncbi:DUF3800 domain-containing protein [Reichenbachiella sp.]
MNLYIDESGNTGETLSKEDQFNFHEQPYYVLSGLLAGNEQEDDLKNHLEDLRTQYHIQGDELKAKNIYESKPKLISDLVDFLTANEFPFFIELMDKQFYLNIQLTEHFIIPSYSLPFNDENNFKRRLISSNLGHYLDNSIYQGFISTIKNYTSLSLESFYDTLINHLNESGHPEISMNVEQTKSDYYERKQEYSEAFKEFLPIPDLNPKQRLIHLLPNYHAFTNLIGRTQKYKDDFQMDEFKILHDEQKQFDIIYQDALNIMKTVDNNQFIMDTEVRRKANFNIDNSIDLNFVDSKSNVLIQVSDLLAGFILRFWKNFNSNEDGISNMHIDIMKKLHYPIEGASLGINYVVPDQDYHKLMRRIL